MESTSWALEGIRRSLRLCSQGVRSFAVADYRNAGFGKDDGACRPWMISTGTSKL